MRWETGPEAARPHFMAGASLGQLNLKRFCPEPRLPGWALPPVTLNLDSEMGSGEPSPTCLQMAPRHGEGMPGHARAVARRASRTGNSEGWGAVAWSTLTSGQGCPTPASEQLLTYHFTGPICSASFPLSAGRRRRQGSSSPRESFLRTPQPGGQRRLRGEGL